MADSAEKDCCRRTRAGWMKRIATYYTAFPVIKNVKCDECTNVLAIRVYEKPDADSATGPEQ